MARAAQQALQERIVNVRKDRLLATLTKNLTSHKAAYDEAVAGYQDKMLEEIAVAESKAKSQISENIRKAKSRANKFDPTSSETFRGNFTIIDSFSLNLPVPKDYSSVYEKAIQICEYENDQVMKLQYSEFVCFVLDEWDWKQEFNTINSRYIAKKN